MSITIDDSLKITHNFNPIVLIWENLIGEGSEIHTGIEIFNEMPILRNNYKDLEFDFSVHMNQIDHLNYVENVLSWKHGINW